MKIQQVVITVLCLVGLVTVSFGGWWAYKKWGKKAGKTETPAATEVKTAPEAAKVVPTGSSEKNENTLAPKPNLQVQETGQQKSE